MKKQNGTAAIILESETKKPYTTSMFDETQSNVFASLPKDQQERISDGEPMIICSLGANNTICKFNMEDYRPPKSAIEAFARALLPKIQEFYSNPDNVKKFEEWEKKQEQNN